MLASEVRGRPLPSVAEEGAPVPTMQTSDWTPHNDTETGRTFYHSKRLKRTTWKVPTGFTATAVAAKPAASAVPANEQNAGSDWVVHVDKATGHKFYHSPRLRRTTWKNPSRMQLGSK